VFVFYLRHFHQNHTITNHISAINPPNWFLEPKCVDFFVKTFRILRILASGTQNHQICDDPNPCSFCWGRKKGKGKGEGEDKRFCLFRTITKMGWGWVGDGLGWIILWAIYICIYIYIYIPLTQGNIYNIYIYTYIYSFNNIYIYIYKYIYIYIYKDPPVITHTHSYVQIHFGAWIYRVREGQTYSYVRISMCADYQ